MGTNQCKKLNQYSKCYWAGHNDEIEKWHKKGIDMKEFIGTGKHKTETNEKN